MPLNTYEAVVHIYEAALHALDYEEKIIKLAQIKELIIYKEPKLLENFFDDVLGFATDTNANVRQFVIEFIEEACTSDPSLLYKSVDRLRFCISDDSPNVLKKIAMIMIQLYKMALTAAVKSHGNNSTDVEAFHYSMFIVEKLISKLETMNNGGFVMMVFKLLESIVIIQSRRQVDSEIPRSKEQDLSLDQIPSNLGAMPLQIDTLEQYGEGLFNILLRLSRDISKSSHMHTFLQLITSIAKQRPQYINKVVNSFKLIHENLQENIKGVQLSSLKKGLKTNLLNLLKHPASLEHQKEICNLLLGLGSTQSEINKAMPRVDDVSRKRKKKDDLALSLTALNKKSKISVNENDVYFDDSIIKKYGKNKQKPVKSSTNYVEDLAKELVPKLNTVIHVADLVLLTMVALPNSMPPTFQSAYTPIEGAGTKSQIEHLSKLMAGQLVSAGYTSIDGSSAKMEDGDGLVNLNDQTDRTILDDFSKSINSSSQLYQIKRAPDVKPFKLEACTKMLPDAQLHPMLHESYWRILGTDMSNQNLERLHKAITTSNANVTSSSMSMISQYTSDISHLPNWHFIRQKILTSIPSMMFGGADLYPILIKHCIQNIRTEFDVLSALVMQEYVNYKAFNISETKESNNSIVQMSSMEDYDKLLSGTLTKMISGGVKYTYVGRLLLEAPLITPQSIETIRNLCSCKEASKQYFQIVRDLILKRMDQRINLLPIILDLSSDDILEVRTAALETGKWLIEELPNYEQEIMNFAKQNLDYLKEPKPSSTMYPLRKTTNALLEWTDQSVRSCLYLFLYLLPSKPDLLHLLRDVYIVAVQPVKHTIIKIIDVPIKEIGMENEELLKLIDNSDHQQDVTLITRIVHILTDKAHPTEDLVDKLKRLYEEKIDDVRLLIPILKGLTRSEILEYLPVLVLQSDKLLSEVFKRLLDVSNFDPIKKEYIVRTTPILPEELLVAVHQLEHRKVELKTIIEASKLCFKERLIFTQERLSIVINQLLELPVLPTLFMRTIMQSYSIYPRMATFVVSVLIKLIKKQIWKNSSLWAGFIRCCEKLGNQSYQVLLQLPFERLEVVLSAIPHFKGLIREFLLKCPPSQRQQYCQTTINYFIDEEQQQQQDVGANENADDKTQSTDNAEHNQMTDTNKETDAGVGINSTQVSEVNPILVKSEKVTSTFPKTVIDKEKLEEERKKLEKTKQLLESSGNKINFLPSDS